MHATPRTTQELIERARRQDAACPAPGSRALAPGDRDHFAWQSVAGKKNIPVARRAKRRLELLERSLQRLDRAARNDAAEGALHGAQAPQADSQLVQELR